MWAESAYLFVGVFIASRLAAPYEIHSYSVHLSECYYLVFYNYIIRQVREVPLTFNDVSTVHVLLTLFITFNTNVMNVWHF